jgi:hypothetical protein
VPKNQPIAVLVHLGLNPMKLLVHISFRFHKYIMPETKKNAIEKTLIKSITCVYTKNSNKINNLAEPPRTSQGRFWASLP